MNAKIFHALTTTFPAMDNLLLSIIAEKIEANTQASENIDESVKTNIEDFYRKQHNAYLTKIQKQVDAIYTEAVKEAASIGAPLTVSEGEIFSFKDYPLTARRVKNLLHSLAKNLNATIVKGIETEWNRAEEKNDALVSSVLGMAETDMPEAVKRVYMTRNAAALAAFTERKQNGLGLSDRVWNYTDKFRSEIEMGLDCCIRDGLSAARTASELKEYLKYPDRLYHRVRDEHGLLQLSKRAKDFHPGRGVYRSSYRNALRLAATEANMAYNTADFQRFQRLDFVVGIEIHLSNNHTIKDRRGKTIRLRDICDELAGRYPKDFHFTGWHPLCRCQVRTILKTKSELKESMRRILRGEKPTAQSENRVTAVPENFEKWLQNNASRVAKSHLLPCFISDNAQYIGCVFSPSQYFTGIAKRSIFTGVLTYAEQYRYRSPKVAALLYDIHKEDIKRSDIENTNLINQLKKECARMTCIDLKEWGVIDETFVMSRLVQNYNIAPPVQYVDNGIVRVTASVQRDMIIFKDKIGREFAYPVGIQQPSIPIKAIEAREVISTFPPYLRNVIAGVSFYDIDCPLDPYWRVKYDNPNHVSAMTDGGKSNVWMPMTKEKFRGYMAHEAGHILDGTYKISSSSGWREAVESDISIWKNSKYGYVTAYARTNPNEDFAESMRAYIETHDEFKKNFPNRARYIREFAKRISD